MSKFFASFYIQAFSNTTPQILHRALWLSPVRTMQWEAKVSILNLDFKKSHATLSLSLSPSLPIMVDMSDKVTF